MIGINAATLDSNLEHICKVALAANSFISVAKLLVYYVFEIKLYMVYGDTKYRRSKALRIGTAIFITIYAAFILVWGIDAVTWGDYSNWPKRDNDECGVIASKWFIFCVVLFDLAFNAVYVWLFMVPIRSILANMKKEKWPTHKKALLQRKVLVHALKTFILCSVLFVASILSGFIYVISGFNAFLIDVAVDAACVYLMTPFYPDKQFFHVFCKLCILACDGHNHTGVGSKDEQLLAVDAQAAGNDAAGDEDDAKDASGDNYESVATNEAINWAAKKVTYTGSGNGASSAGKAKHADNLASAIDADKTN